MLKMVHQASMSAMRQFQIFKGICAAFFALVLFAMPVNASLVSIAPGGSGALSTSADFFSADVDFENVSPLTFSHIFKFTNSIGSDTTLNFEINTTQVDGNPIGIANLEFAFTGPGGAVTFSGITNALGVLFPSPTLLSYFFGTAADTILTVSGLLIQTGSDPVSGSGSYDFTATVIPIPPALILFGTSLLGMGIVASRRRRKTGSKMVSA